MNEKQIVTIKKLGINGEGIGYLRKKVVLVDNALPDEVVELKELDNKGTYFTAKVKKIQKISVSRIKPKCKIYDKCRVCSLMPLDYSKQMEFKKQFVVDALEKYANQTIEIDKIIGAEYSYSYRNSIKLPILFYNGALRVGMYNRGSNNFVNLDHCVIQDKAINNTISELLKILNNNKFRDYDKKNKTGLRYLLMRSFNNKIMITLVGGSDVIFESSVINQIMDIDKVVSLNYSVNNKKTHQHIVGPIKNIYGNKFITVNFDKYKFNLSASAFFQLNTIQAEKLYQIVREYLGTENNIVLDLYSGVGSISCFINECSEKIIGVEINPDAVKDAQNNMKLNDLNNLEFICDDVENAIQNIAKRKNIDAIIVDPPRTGLSELTIRSIVKSKTNKLIYVSCNPSTLAKDISLLKKCYQIADISIVDMFSHTSHVECVCLLTRIEG